MKLIAQIPDKFTVGEDSHRVALDVVHGDGVLDFLHSLVGMEVNVEIEVLRRNPKNETGAAVETELEGQTSLFEGASSTPEDATDCAVRHGFMRHEDGGVGSWRRHLPGGGYLLLTDEQGLAPLDLATRVFVGHFDADEQLLNEMDEEHHEAIMTLREALEKWGKSGILPDEPVDAGIPADDAPQMGSIDGDQAPTS